MSNESRRRPRARAGPKIDAGALDALEALLKARQLAQELEAEVASEREREPKPTWTSQSAPAGSQTASPELQAAERDVVFALRTFGQLSRPIGGNKQKVRTRFPDKMMRTGHADKLIDAPAPEPRPRIDEREVVVKSESAIRTEPVERTRGNAPTSFTKEKKYTYKPQRASDETDVCERCGLMRALAHSQSGSCDCD
jgi:hypothetical protein